MTFVTILVSSISSHDILSMPSISYHRANQAYFRHAMTLQIPPPDAHSHLLIVHTNGIITSSLLRHATIPTLLLHSINQLLPPRTPLSFSFLHLNLTTLPRLLITEPCHQDVLLRQPRRRMCRPTYERRIIDIRPLRMMFLHYAFWCYEVHEFPTFLKPLKLKSPLNPLPAID